MAHIHIREKAAALLSLTLWLHTSPVVRLINVDIESLYLSLPCQACPYLLHLDQLDAEPFL